MESDTAAFRQFFDELLPRVLGVAERVTGDRASAEDVAAEAFARAYVRWGKVSPLEWRDGWILRVTTNLAVDIVRARAKRPPAPSTEAGNWSDAVDLRLALGSSLQRLPKSQRQAVALRYLADMSESDVATAMGVRPGTVKSHLHRATKTLRTDLGEYMEGIK